MKNFIAVICFCLYSFGQASASGVLSFKDWKDQKIKTAELAVQKSDQLFKKSQLIESGTVMRATFKSQLLHDRWSLEAAKDLSVSDYLVIYLSDKKEKTKFFEAAAQLSPADMAEVLEAYDSTLPKLTNQNALSPGSAVRINNPQNSTGRFQRQIPASAGLAGAR